MISKFEMRPAATGRDEYDSAGGCSTARTRNKFKTMAKRIYALMS